MRDKYSCFAELSTHKVNGRDYHIRFSDRGSKTVIIAIHGGRIEAGTSEIAEGIAANDCSFYTFEGTMPSRNRDLHITSHRFDEPQCLYLLEAAFQILSVHGESSAAPVVFLGGKDTTTLKRIQASLAAAGFTVKTSCSQNLEGLNEHNICNRSRSGQGVQLELSKGLRRSFFTSLSRTGRQNKTQAFNRFVSAVREALLSTQAIRDSSNKPG